MPGSGETLPRLLVGWLCPRCCWLDGSVPPQEEDGEGDKLPCSRHCYKDILSQDNCVLAGGISLLLSRPSA